MSHPIFRDGCVDFLQALETKRVPFIVYSAGIGNVIEALFEKYYKRIPSNVNIISNWMDFNEEVQNFGSPFLQSLIFF